MNGKRWDRFNATRLENNSSHFRDFKVTKVQPLNRLSRLYTTRGKGGPGLTIFPFVFVFAIREHPNTKAKAIEMLLRSRKAQRRCRPTDQTRKTPRFTGGFPPSSHQPKPSWQMASTGQCWSAVGPVGASMASTGQRLPGPASTGGPVLTSTVPSTLPCCPVVE